MTDEELTWGIVTLINPYLDQPIEEDADAFNYIKSQIKKARQEGLEQAKQFMFSCPPDMQLWQFRILFEEKFAKTSVPSGTRRG